MADRRPAYFVAALVFALDQLTKWIVTGPLGLNRLGAQLYLLPIFDFTYTENNGISLGLLNASNPTGRWLLVAMTGAIALAVAYWITREKNSADRVALGMVLGGALGNIVDRVRHGYVVDFADLHFRGIPPHLCPSYENGLCRPFLVFNVADAAISIAVLLLLLRAFLVRKEKAGDDDPEETIEHA